MEAVPQRATPGRARRSAAMAQPGAASPQNDTWGDATRLDFDERCRR